MRYQTVLLDLDGTITDSGPGIMGGVRYALEKHGMEVPGEEELRTFIGPPLKEQFRDFCGITDSEAAEMVSSYREYYGERGIFENRLYEGVIQLLKRLKDAGITVAMATSKPEKYAVQIAEYFGIAEYFAFIGGALMDGRRTAKKEVIEYVLASCGVDDREAVIMVMMIISSTDLANRVAWSPLMPSWMEPMMAMAPTHTVREAETKALMNCPSPWLPVRSRSQVPNRWSQSSRFSSSPTKPPAAREITIITVPWVSRLAVSWPPEPVRFTTSIWDRVPPRDMTRMAKPMARVMVS